MIAGIAEKRDVTGSGFVDRRHLVNRRGAVSDDFAADVSGKIIEGASAGHLLLVPIIVGFDDLAGDIDALIAVKDL